MWIANRTAARVGVATVAAARCRLWGPGYPAFPPVPQRFAQSQPIS